MQGKGIQSGEVVAQSQNDLAQLLQMAIGHYQAGRLHEAARICHRVLEGARNHPDALHLLGLLARKEGKNDLAIEYIAKAIKIHPAGLMYFNLGNAYRAQEKFDDALDCFRNALLLTPNHVQTHNNMGLVLQIQGKLDEATECFLKAINIRTDHAEVYSNLGDVLHENGYWGAAVESLRRAITLKPDLANAHLNLGKVLRKQGKFKEALISCQKAYALDPGHVGVNVALACVYQDEGRFDLARKHIDHALSLDSHSAEALAILPYLGKMTLDDESWAKNARSLLEIESKPNEKILLNYALGKYFDDTCQYETAFDYYTHANHFKKQMTRPFGRADFSRRIDSIISLNNQEVVRKRHTGSSLSQRPIFIVGMPRSGTSLTEQILASHREIYGAGELHYWDLKAAESLPDTQVLHADAAWLGDVACEYEAELNRHSATALRVIDKMPGNFLNLGMIHAAFPEARIIHVCRNPVDTCLSIYFNDFSAQHPYANDLDDLAYYYREYRRLMNHWKEVFPSGIFIDVPYEALVEDQEFWSRKLIEFAGLDWDEGCLNFHHTERVVGTFSNWQVRQKIYKTSKERWRNYEKFLGPLLDGLGDLAPPR